LPGVEGVIVIGAGERLRDVVERPVALEHARERGRRRRLVPPRDEPLVAREDLERGARRDLRLSAHVEGARAVLEPVLRHLVVGMEIAGDAAPVTRVDDDVPLGARVMGERELDRWELAEELVEPWRDGDADGPRWLGVAEDEARARDHRA